MHNLPNVTTQWYPAETQTRDLMITNPMSYRVNHYATSKVPYKLPTIHYKIKNFLCFLQSGK